MREVKIVIRNDRLLSFGVQKVTIKYGKAE